MALAWPSHGQGFHGVAASSRLFLGGFNSEFSAASIFCEGLVFREVVLSRDFFIVCYAFKLENAIEAAKNSEKKAASI